MVSVSTMKYSFSKHMTRTKMLMIQGHNNIEQESMASSFPNQSRLINGFTP